MSGEKIKHNVNSSLPKLKYQSSIEVVAEDHEYDFWRKNPDRSATWTQPL